MQFKALGIAVILGLARDAKTIHISATVVVIAIRILQMYTALGQATYQLTTSPTKFTDNSEDTEYYNMVGSAMLFVVRTLVIRG